MMVGLSTSAMSHDRDISLDNDTEAPELPCTICEGQHPPNPRLCGNCQSWNDIPHLRICDEPSYLKLDAYRFMNRGSQGPRGVHPHTFDDIAYQDLNAFKGRRGCMICQLVSDSVQHFGQQHISNGSKSALKFGLWRPFLMRHVASTAYTDSSTLTAAPSPNASLTGRICILPGVILTQSNGTSSFTPLVLKLVLYYRHDSYDLQHVEKWMPNPISLPNLTAWLDDCRHNHGDECNDLLMPMVAPPGLRLIDTQLNRIVDWTTPNADYVALSYCWAAATPETTSPTPADELQLQLDNIDLLSRDHGLDISRLPPVLADAIQLCRDLGKRYLWVDRLCIIQDDAKSKHSQITAMDRIYHMADFTIVALSSKPGLPGVSSHPKDTSPEALYGLWDGPFESSIGLAYGPAADRAIRGSRWDARGWTFQERKLSRRLVFVDDQRAYFSCYQGARWEHDTRVGADTVHDSSTSGLQVEPSFVAYACCAIPYSMRELSFRSDILNAFAGVGNVLSSRMETEMLFGIPERYLLQGLLWRSDDFAVGRDETLGIPSWSWASWDGIVDYGPGFRATFGLRGEGGGSAGTPNLYGPGLRYFRGYYPSDVGNLVTFWYSDKKQVRRVVEDKTWFGLDHMTEEEFWDYLDEEWVRGDRLAERGEWETRAHSWRGCWHNPWKARRYEGISDEARGKGERIPGSLVFTTTRASLWLHPAKQTLFNTPATAVCFDMMTSAPKPDTNIDKLPFVGRTMLMEKQWAEQIFDDPSRTYRVVVIGAGVAWDVRSYGQPGWKDFAPGAPWGLCVLITEEIDGVLYRLASGVVDLIAWTDLRPSWESVVLG